MFVFFLKFYLELSKVENNPNFYQSNNEDTKKPPKTYRKHMCRKKTAQVSKFVSSDLNSIFHKLSNIASYGDLSIQWTGTQKDERSQLVMLIRAWLNLKNTKMNAKEDAHVGQNTCMIACTRSSGKGSITDIVTVQGSREGLTTRWSVRELWGMIYLDCDGDYTTASKSELYTNQNLELHTENSCMLHFYFKKPSFFF